MTTAVSSSILQMATIARDNPSRAKSKVEGVSTVSQPLPEPPPPVVKIVSPPSLPYLEPSAQRFWSSGLLASLALHGVIVGGLMINWTFFRPKDESPPAAMVVELAVMPASPPVQPSEVPPGPEQVEAAPEPKPVEKMLFDPPPQVDAALKPDFALPLKELAKPTETKVVAKTARETTAPQTVEAPKLDKSEAPVEGSNAAPPSDAEQAWEGRFLAKLQRAKRYPAAAEAAGQQDIVYVRIVMDRRGKLIDAKLHKSKGFSLLDGETMALVRRASPYPPVPESMAGQQIVRVVPIDFFVKKR